MRRVFTLLSLLITMLLADVKDLDVVQFEKLRQKGVPVVDIRTPAEWRETGIIKGSHPVMFFASDGSYDVRKFLRALKKLGIDEKSPFILVCRSASRTKMVGDFLSDKLGYREVYHLKGGILNWKAHGKPLVRYAP